MIKCPNCGTMNEAGSRFCFQCGQTLTGDTGSGNGDRTQPIPPPGFPPPPFPGSTQPPSGFGPLPTPQGNVGFPQSSNFPQDPYATGGGYQSPGGYPPGAPPGYMMPPEPPKRRRWLWIILGIVLGCILVCAALGVWGATTGGDTFVRWGTEISDFSTEEAGN